MVTGMLRPIALTVVTVNVHLVLGLRSESTNVARISEVSSMALFLPSVVGQ